MADEAAAGDAGRDANRDQIRLLTRLVDQMVTVRTQSYRPKAIQCRMYKLGDSWPDFVTHFYQCVKAAYAFNLPADEDALEAACLSWLPSKLEPGPTLVAYQALEDDKKTDWKDLVDALKDCFADDTERELFLADVASFRRGNKGLVEYKNELLRRMKLYQPDLANVPTEFQRQATSRFIEGLESAELKRKLRKHCKRERANIEMAFNFAVDSEAADLQTRIREGDSTGIGHKSLASANIQSSGAKPKDPGQYRGVQEEIQGLSAKHKITEMQINELAAKSALTEDRITIRA